MVRERVGDWRSAWRFGLAGLLAGVLVASIAPLGVFDGPFFAAQDQLFPAPAPDPQIALVALDSASEKRTDLYPLANSYHAAVINYLASLHPKVILFDITLDKLTGPDPETGADTNAPLVAAIKAARTVVLVCTADDSPRPEFVSSTDGTPVAAAVGDRGLAPPDAANAVRGVVLRPKSTCPANESNEPAFLQALRISQGVMAPLTSSGSEANFGSHRIPLVNGQMLINFTRGGSPTCVYVDAYNRSCPHPELITNHIVIVGSKVIDAGDVYSQVVNFPHDASFCPPSRPKCMLDNQNYGYRIVGDAMSTVLQDRYLRVQPQNSTLAATLLLSVIIGLLVYLLRFRTAMMATAAMIGLYFLLIVFLGRAGYLADPLYTPLAIVLSATFSLAARYVLEERERRKVERIFGHYVDPRIVQQLAAARSVNELMRTGERRDLTLLFVDIRGFTSMSEAMAAEEVVCVIQDYLDGLSTIILRWDGTIDKYVGDEIVAIWNAPTKQPNHALLAVRCAYDLINYSATLQDKLATQNLPPISWGIGVNTGPAVVGNMGSRDRLQYTALGDTVNTAARYCGAAPAFSLLIGSPTYEAVKDFVAVDEIPGLQLKGKSAEKFRVYRVTAVREDAASPWVAFPTDDATAHYEIHRSQYSKPAIFVQAEADE